MKDVSIIQVQAYLNFLELEKSFKKLAHELGDIC
jgi:hypothetical protein